MGIGCCNQVPIRHGEPGSIKVPFCCEKTLVCTDKNQIQTGGCLVVGLGAGLLAVTGSPLWAALIGGGGALIVGSTCCCKNPRDVLNIELGGKKLSPGVSGNGETFESALREAAQDVQANTQANTQAPLSDQQRSELAQQVDVKYPGTNAYAHNLFFNLDSAELEAGLKDLAVMDRVVNPAFYPKMMQVVTRVPTVALPEMER